MNSRLKVHLVIVGIASVLFGTQILGQPGAPPTDFETVRVADDLFAFYNPGAPGNAAALVTDEGVVLIDAKNPVDYDNLMTAVRGITDQPISYVINTHHHGDHVGSNTQLKADGAVIVASENQYQNMVQSHYETGRPSITFEERANVRVGGKTIELYYFGRGHTNGDIVAYFPAQRALATGDLYVTGVGQLIDYAAGGSAKAWTKTLDAMLELDFDAAIPGHGVVANKDDVRRFRESTVSLRNRVSEMVENQAPPEGIEQMLRSEFNWGNLHVYRGLSGVIAEMRVMP